MAIKLAVLVLLVGVGAGLAYIYGGELKLARLAERETQFREFYQAHPAKTLAVAFLAYVLVTGLSLPGAAPMSVAYGWLFGFVPAVILVSFASTTGATKAFLLSRYLVGGWIQSKFGKRLVAFNQAMEREGAFYLFTLRLIPQVPFFVLNAVMGLTKIRTRTFWWVSQLGMLPGTCIIVYAGASAPSLTEISQNGVRSVISLKVILALTALGVFPIAAKWTIAAWQRRSHSKLKQQ